MPCIVCKVSEGLPYTCKFCSQEFCSQHRLPETHDCDGLKKWKENRTVENIIYPATREKKEKPAQGKQRFALSENTLKAAIVGFLVLALLIFAFFR